MCLLLKEVDEMKWQSLPDGLLKALKCLIVYIFVLGFLVSVVPGQTQGISDNPEVIQVSPYYSYFETTLPDGTPITANIISGPAKPPLGRIPLSFPPIPENTTTGIIPDFPSYSWVFGCSAVSGAMIAAYYDHKEYTNMYAGATNGGLYPLTDSGFGSWTDGAGQTYPNNPLVASKQSVDGLAVRGSIDDYWVSFGSNAPDPYLSGGWAEHTTKTAIGDWMGTSQSAKTNTDGATTFYSYLNSASQLSCDALAGYNPPDGNRGRREFYASRGYTATDCYNQMTDNTITGGFSFANYKAEIDAGHPVLINLQGHSIVGYGYADPDRVYIRDTWSSNTAENRYMTWGGSYQEMAMQSVSILHLQAVSLAPTDISLSSNSIPENSPVNTAIGTLSSVDPDPGDTFTYSLVPGAGDSNNSLFNISGNTLRSSSLFDFEEQASYFIRVRSTDSTGLNYEKAFTIFVTNVNEAPFNVSLSAATIPENSPVNTAIGTLNATDPDGDTTFTYSLVAGSGDGGNGSFNISGNLLRNSSLLDYESQESYSIRVRVSDQGGLSFEKMFTIMVTNVNEAPINVSLSETTTPENSVVNTIIGTFSATDPDGDTNFTYSLVAGSGDGGNGFFNISGNTLRNSSILDYESQASYSIRVRVGDPGGLYLEKVFTITVTNVNEAPVGITLSHNTVPEGQPAGTQVGVFSTQDPDNGDQFTYELVNGQGDSDNSLFAISNNSLRTAAELTYPVHQMLSIRVRTTDQGGLTFETTFSIHVGVVQKPVFLPLIFK